VDAELDRQDPAAKSVRLRAYQEQLLARMQAASAGGAVRHHQLGVEIGATGYLIELTETGEIVSVPAFAPVPLTRPWFLGLANVRGTLLGVIDLARYLDEDAGPAMPATARLVTFSPALGVPCALLATRVVGLRHAADMEARDGRLHDGDGRVWTPLSLAALAAEERFMDVAL
jgi:twitching motility protein PilI